MRVDTAKYPQARYTSKLVDFVDDKPTRVVGELIMRGVARPVDLIIGRFKCMSHPMLKREVCGAVVTATLQRDAFGIDAGKDWGFVMNVLLRIQVEAVAEEAATAPRDEHRSVGGEDLDRRRYEAGDSPAWGPLKPSADGRRWGGRRLDKGREAVYDSVVILL